MIVPDNSKNIPCRISSFNLFFIGKGSADSRTKNKNGLTSISLYFALSHFPCCAALTFKY